MKAADIANDCTASDLLRDLCKLSQSRWVIDINGQLPMWALQGCGKARPVRQGTKAALADSRLKYPQLLHAEQESDTLALTPVVLKHAVLHTVVEPDPETGAICLPPWILDVCMLGALAVMAVPIPDPSPLAGSAYLEQISALLAQGVHPPALMGYHHLYQLGRDPGRPYAIVLMGQHASNRPAPPKRVLAIVSTINDIDIIVDTIEHLWSKGVDVHVVDNWSRDGSYQILKQLRQARPDRLVGLKRYPADRPDEQYDWHGILTRKEPISVEAGYDWYLNYDSDELRVSPWPGVTLAQALSVIDAMGYNAIDHTLINFCPTIDGFNAQS